MIVSMLLAIQVAAQDTSRLTLAAAVARALGEQPSVAAARASRDAAAAAVGVARAPLFPRVAATFSANEYKIGNLVYPLSGLSPANPPIFNSTLSQAAVSLGYTVWDFGGRRSQLDLAQAQARKADAALGATEAALIGRVANAYLDVLTDRGVLGAEQQRLAALMAEANRVTQLEAQGKAAHVDVLRLAAEVSRAEADEVGMRARLDVAERSLALLVGLPVDSVRVRLVSVHLADTTVGGRAALVASAERYSPDVLQAQRAAEAAAAGVGAARSAWFPKLELSAAYLENGHSFTGYRPYWSAGLQIQYPLFTGFSRSHAVRQNEAGARAANEQLRAARQTAEQSVDAALAAVTAAGATVGALRSAVEQSAEVERIRLLAVQVGSGTETDYLDAEATLLSNRASLVQAQNAEIAARVELARVTGVLGEGWLARVLAN
jgi:outer membrane protein TolC